MSSPVRFSLRLLGGCILEDSAGPIAGPAVQRRRLACLALVAAAGRAGASRDYLVSYLWPESSADQARHLLSNTLYVFRSVLGDDALQTIGDRVVVNPSVVVCDVALFIDALQRRDWTAAVAAYGGPFLDGFHISDAAEFERWIDGERERHHASYASALEELARAAERRGSVAEGIDWWRRLAAARPYDGSVARRLANALAEAGDRAGAVRQLGIHATLLREDLGMEPDPALLELEESLRLAPERPDIPATEPVTRRDAAPEPAQARVGEAEPAVVEVPAGPAPSAAPADHRARVSPRKRAVASLATLLIVLAAAVLYRASLHGSVAAASQPPGEVRAVAVLPFVNVSGQPENEYFSDGITEEILNALAQEPRLRVVGRTSAFAFKGRTEDLTTIGRRLHVGYLVEGSVQRDGSRLRIAARLIDARTGYELWSDKFDRAAGDVFAVEDEISRSVAEQLRTRLAAAVDAGPLVRAGTANLLAYDAYLKGLQGLNTRTREPLQEAVRYFSEAVTRDSMFAAAHAGLASAYMVLAGYHLLPLGESLPHARAAAARALALDDASPEAHTARGAIAMESHDWPTAEREYRRAIQLRPSFALAHSWLGSGLAQHGRVAEGTGELQRAAELDPLSPGVYAGLSLALSAMGDTAGAVAAARRATELDSTFADGHMNLAGALVAEGRADDATREAERAVALTDGRGAEELATLGAICARAGQMQRARDVLTRLEQLDAPVAPLGSEALIWANIGARDTAVALLARSHDIDANYRMWLVTAPLWEPLRADARWPGIVHRIIPGS